MTLKIFRATERQLSSLKNVLERNPGTYEVFVHIMPEESHQPFFVPYRIDPSEKVLAEVKASVGRYEAKIIHPKQIGQPEREPALT